jgi:hypothetical protein
MFGENCLEKDVVAYEFTPEWTSLEIVAVKGLYLVEL